MPISSFFGLQTTLRGLLAQQRAMDTTSHNIANANTAGYSRQTATLTAAPALRLPAGALQTGGGADLGAGVDVQAYQRIRDLFLDAQYRSQSAVLGDNSATADALDRAELALAEPGDNGINALLGKFWSAWSDLANSPENAAARQALVDQATTLAGAFSSLDAQLDTVKSDAQGQYAALTGPGGDVASMAAEIASLNGAIAGAEQGGTTPNDLLDRRDVLLDKLSSLARVSVVDLGGGSIEVDFGDAAQPLVSGSSVNWPQSLTTPGGQLGALLRVSQPGGTIDSYKADLDGVAKQLADAVNSAHGSPPFFTYNAASPASTLTVNVTASTLQAGNGGAPGANDIALTVAALRGGAADQSYSALVTRIGSDLAGAQRTQANAQVLVGAVDDRRQSVAGVSMDEEMTNLVRFQRGYQASARAMTTMDDLLDTLINRTGKVGL
jgi:flagellar hook-associated protein 1 FlgK